jgi:O-antigen ligase
VAGVFFAFRRPAANAFLNLTLVGMGGAPLIAGYTYGRISAFVALLTVLVLVLRRREKRAVGLDAVARGPLAWFAGVCLIISAKIVIETVIYGIDASRKTDLRSGLTEAAFPVVVMLLAEIHVGPARTSRDLLAGMITFPVLMVAGYLPFALKHNLLRAAWDGSAPFSFGMADTINSARVLAYGLIASLLIFSIQRKRRAAVGFLAAGITFCFVMLILLSGNRQYLLAVLGFLPLWAFLLPLPKRWRWFGGIALLGCSAILLFVLVTASEFLLKERITSSALDSEILDLRGPIWSNAYHAVLEHPVLGTGFKNFGEEYVVEDTSGDYVIIRDSAHGAFQDVFTEHGILLGIAFLVGCIQLIILSWRYIEREPKISAEKALALGLIALMLTLPFSCGFLTATPVFILLIVASFNNGQRPFNRIECRPFGTLARIQKRALRDSRA